MITLGVGNLFVRIDKTDYVAHSIAMGIFSSLVLSSVSTTEIPKLNTFFNKVWCIKRVHVYPVTKERSHYLLAFLG